MIKVTTEETLLRDVSDLIEIREDSNLWNSNNNSNSKDNNSNSQNGGGGGGGDVPSSSSSYPLNKHITLLLFRDGEHLNLLKVVDRCEEASPTSGAMRYDILFLFGS